MELLFGVKIRKKALFSDKFKGAVGC